MVAQRAEAGKAAGKVIKGVLSELVRAFDLISEERLYTPSDRPKEPRPAQTVPGAHMDSWNL